MSGDFIRDAAAAFGSAPALIDRARGQSLTFNEIEETTRDIAQALLGQDLKICATWQPNSREHVLLVVAALRCGVPIFPISTRWPVERAREIATFATSAFRPFSHPRFATILATSGSSGEPKMVVHSLAAHLASAGAAQAKIPLGPGCGWLLNLPLAHVSGLSILFRCLIHGAAIVLPAEDDFADPRVTHASVVSTQLRRLLEKRIRLPHLQALLVGGGPVPADLVNAAIAANYPIHLTYGMTETCSQITTTRKLARPADAFSSGSANPGMQLRPGGDGAVEVKSESLCLGYLQDVDICPAVGADGWFATGDLGRIDEEGEFWYSGRADRMFISGGENIHPEHIEHELERLESVRRAVVLPIPDAQFGQRPAAFIAWQDLPEEDALRENLLARLPKFMLPVRIFPWPAEVDSSTAKISLKPFRAYIDALYRVAE